MAQAKKDNTNVSDALANEARELGIEPSSYSSTDALQERVDHVRAERDAVRKDGQADLQAERADEVEASANGVMTTENTPSDTATK